MGWPTPTGKCAISTEPNIKTLRGSSYNSYLIREEKNVLIDTVDHKFSREFVQNLRSEIDLADIDYIVINHAEEDHAGALTELMNSIPDTPIYCTANAIDSITGHHHHPEWNFKVVKTGDSLDLGNGKQLIFVETPDATLAGQHDDLYDRRRGAVQQPTPSASTTATSTCSTMKWIRPSCSSSASDTTLTS
ncbi:Anaerobic nitric oxide reductase flavorubredoxin [Raoultella terrigena]|uniref:Anaerobic nitric oxide reductase flavorubredoxin n=1 Tax=Raoultella terrigena TaxID=577 RepID=A0A4U9D5Y2_RAOTE|nr:Anaerobic nitric oxide reductase flavorubredoxin [Raoultella terrigena]